MQEVESSNVHILKYSYDHENSLWSEAVLQVIHMLTQTHRHPLTQVKCTLTHATVHHEGNCTVQSTQTNLTELS